MVIRRSVEKLRGRPKEDRVAVAGSIAIGVVIILFLGWFFYFFRTVAQTASRMDYSAVPVPDLSALPQQYPSLPESQSATSQPAVQ